MIDTRIDQPISPIMEIEINEDTVTKTMDTTEDNIIRKKAEKQEDVFEFVSKALVEECNLKEWPKQSRDALERELKLGLNAYNFRVQKFQTSLQKHQNTMGQEDSLKMDENNHPNPPTLSYHDHAQQPAENSEHHSQPLEEEGSVLVLPPNSNTSSLSPLQLHNITSGTTIDQIMTQCNCACHVIYQKLLQRWKMHQAYLQDLQRKKLEYENNRLIMSSLAKNRNTTNNQFEYENSRPHSSITSLPSHPWGPLCTSKQEWIETRTRGYWNAKNIDKFQLFGNSGSQQFINSYLPIITSMKSLFGLANFPDPESKPKRKGMQKIKPTELKLDYDIHLSILYPEKIESKNEEIESHISSPVVGCYWDSIDWDKIKTDYYHCSSVAYYPSTSNYTSVTKTDIVNSSVSGSSDGSSPSTNPNQISTFDIDPLSTIFTDSHCHHVDIEYASSSRLLIELFLSDPISKSPSGGHSVPAMISTPEAHTQNSGFPLNRPPHSEAHLSIFSLSPAVSSKLSWSQNGPISSSSSRENGENSGQKQNDLANHSLNNPLNPLPVSVSGSGSYDPKSTNTQAYRNTQASLLKEPKALNRIYVTWPKTFTHSQWLHHLADLKIFQSVRGLSDTNSSSNFKFSLDTDTKNKTTNNESRGIGLNNQKNLKQETRGRSLKSSQIGNDNISTRRGTGTERRPGIPVSSLLDTFTVHNERYLPPNLENLCLLFEITAELQSERILDPKPWKTKSIPMTQIINRQNTREFSVGWSFLPIKSIIPLQFVNKNKSQISELRKQSLTFATNIKKYDKSVNLHLAIFGGAPTHLNTTKCLPTNPVFLTTGRDQVASSNYYAPNTVRENVLLRLGRFKEKPPHLIVSVCPLSSTRIPSAFLHLGIPRPCIALESQLEILTLYRKILHVVFSSEAKDPVLGEDIFDAQVMSRYQRIPLTIFSSTKLSTTLSYRNSASNVQSWNTNSSFNQTPFLNPLRGILTPRIIPSNRLNCSGDGIQGRLMQNSLSSTKFGIGASKANLISETFSMTPSRSLSPLHNSSSHGYSTGMSPFYHSVAYTPGSPTSRFLSILLVHLPKLLEDTHFTNISSHLIQKFSTLEALIPDPQDWLSHFVISSDIQPLSKSKNARTNLESRLRLQNLQKTKSNPDSSGISNCFQTLDLTDTQRILFLILSGYWSLTCFSVAFLSNDQFNVEFPQKESLLYKLWNKYRALTTNNVQLAASLTDSIFNIHGDDESQESRLISNPNTPESKIKSIEKTLQRLSLTVNQYSEPIEFDSFSNRVIKELKAHSDTGFDYNSHLHLRSSINNSTKFTSCSINPEKLIRLLSNRYFVLSSNFIINSSLYPPAFTDSSKRKKSKKQIVEEEIITDVSLSSMIAVHPTLALSRLFIPLHPVSTKVAANVHCHFQPVPMLSDSLFSSDIHTCHSDESAQSNVSISEPDSESQISETVHHCPQCGNICDKDTSDTRVLTCFHCFHETELSETLLEFRKKQYIPSQNDLPDFSVHPEKYVAKNTQEIHVPVVLQTPFLYCEPFDIAETRIDPNKYFRWQESV